MAARAGVSIDTLRYYDRRGLLPPAARLDSGYRLYHPAVLATIALVRQLQGLGMTLDEIGLALQAPDRPEATCESERWRLEAVLERVQTRLVELTELEQRLRNVLTSCSDGQCALRMPSRAT